MTSILFGVKAATLSEARDWVEKTLNIALDEREGLHAGGVHFTLGLPKVLDLMNNIDLDDEEMEFDGLAEPDFPEHPFLLYLFETEAAPHILGALEAAPDRFEKLRTRTPGLRTERS